MEGQEGDFGFPDEDSSGGGGSQNGVAERTFLTNSTIPLLDELIEKLGALPGNVGDRRASSLFYLGFGRFDDERVSERPSTACRRAGGSVLRVGLEELALGTRVEYRVVVEIVRLPRILLVTLCGMGLPLSGAAMQGVFRNPLVSPDIAGVSAGASFGGVLAIMLSLSQTGMVSLAFLFGLIALVAAFSLARLAARSGILGLVLSGVIVGAFFGALVGLGEYVADPQSR